ncbi:hypothetical protein [Polystyrenella longa]|nr:hypothetical protein [Polystyrenella longa]
MFSYFADEYCQGAKRFAGVLFKFPYAIISTPPGAKDPRQPDECGYNLLSAAIGHLSDSVKEHGESEHERFINAFKQDVKEYQQLRPDFSISNDPPLSDQELELLICEPTFI